MPRPSRGKDTTLLRRRKPASFFQAAPDDSRTLSLDLIVSVRHLVRPMPDRQKTILCVSSYEKGTEFFRTCKQMGWRVLLLTVEKLRGGDWPCEAIDEFFYMPEDILLEHLIYTV